LKRETRILGLTGTTIRNRTIVIGVVFRGSLWLDGVVTVTLDTAGYDFEREISRAIKSSKQYPQLYAIIVSHHLSRNRKISIRDLAKRLRLPVISIARSPDGSRAEPFLRAPKIFGIVVDGKHLEVTAAGVGRAETQRLYEIGCTQGSKIPEAVRVADLMAEQLGRGLLNPQGDMKRSKATKRTKAISSRRGQ
jgi:endonuclease V-like protein UPF0215 family